MRVYSSGASKLKNFLSILFGITFGAIFVLLLATSSVPTTTLQNINLMSRNVNNGPITPTPNALGYLVTVPRLEKITKKHQVLIRDGNIRVAKWPKSTQWPKPWIREPHENMDESPADSNPMKGSSFTCHIGKIASSLKPALPRHFTSRRFHVLPKRYTAMLPKSDPAPYCGTSGLHFPQKLLRQQKTTQEIWMLFVVKSAPSYEENRISVRNTWGSSSNSNKYGIFVLFVIGKTNDETVNINLRKENQKFGDILQCNFLDEYHALPIKVLSTFRWILEQELNVKFVTMTDDDCLVNLPRMQYFIDANVTTDPDYQKKVYCGLKLLHDGKPHREETKWALTIEQYSGDYFPTFCHGGLWTLSPRLMKGIYCLSEITDFSDFFLEDVLLTGILREKLNFKDTNIKQMVERRTPRNEVMLFHVGNDKKYKSSGSRMLSEWKIMKKRWESSVKKIYEQQTL
ncbi:uncharacterized protein LOC120328290 [Styela clava]